MENRTKNSVKITTLFTALIISIACFTTACQPTPEEPIVVNKSNSFYDDIEATDEETNDDTNTEPSNAQPDNNEENRLEREFLNNKVEVIIDAEIKGNNLNKYPIFSVIPLRISQEQIDKSIELLLEDRTIYADVRGKQDIETQIIETQSEIFELQNSMNESNDNSLQPIVDELLADVSKLQDELATASDIQRIPASNFDIVENDNRMVLYAQDESGDESCYVANISQYTHASGISYYANSDSHYSEVKNDVPVDEITLTHEREVTQANMFLDEIGIADVAIVEADIVKRDGADVQTVVLKYAKDYDGITITQTDAVPLSDSDGTQYSPAFIDLVEIEIWVEDDKITHFRLQNNEDRNEVINDNANLLDFDKIIDISENFLYYKYADTADYDKTVINIDEVRLSYMRARDKDNESEYIVLPVWDFMGKASNYIDGTELPSVYMGNLSFITINAIDGSIIDRNLGY